MSLLPGIDPRDPRVAEVFAFLEERGMVAGLGHVSILPAGAAIPSGWKETNGELLSTDAYRSLFLVIGTTYGGNGVTTFALPTWSGTVIGAGARFIMRVR